MDNNKIIAYLSGGALVEIFRDHAGAKHVWIREEDDGTVIHTFTKPDNGVGGHAVPWMLLQEGKLYSERLGETREFLRSFGLSHAKAEEVIQNIGIF